MRGLKQCIYCHMLSGAGFNNRTVKLSVKQYSGCRMRKYAVIKFFIHFIHSIIQFGVVSDFLGAFLGAYLAISFLSTQYRHVGWTRLVPMGIDLTLVLLLLL